MEKDFGDGVLGDAVLWWVTGAFLILQGKMSPNFRASYTETLSKLETQYCKLMVSERPALPREPPELRRGEKKIGYRAGGFINNSLRPGNLELQAEAPAELARIRVQGHC